SLRLDKQRLTRIPWRTAGSRLIGTSFASAFWWWQKRLLTQKSGKKGKSHVSEAVFRKGVVHCDFGRRAVREFVVCSRGRRRRWRSRRRRRVWRRPRRRIWRRGISRRELW